MWKLLSRIKRASKSFFQPGGVVPEDLPKKKLNNCKSNSSKVLSFYTGKQVDENALEDARLWGEIYTELGYQINELNEKRLPVVFVALGLHEYSLCVRVTSKSANRYMEPHSLNGVPIILVPEPNYLRVLPGLFDLWRQFRDDY